MIGKRTYDMDATARDSWICALLTHGEGYHSYHHRFPSDYRNGIRWYQWDPTKWLAKALGWLGLARHLKRASDVQILAVRSEVEQKEILHLMQEKQFPELSEAVECITHHYGSLKSKLKAWEIYHSSSKLLKARAAQLKKARQEFFETRKEWLRIVRWYAFLTRFEAQPA